MVTGGPPPPPRGPAEPPPIVSLAASLCFALYATARAMTACSRPLLAPLGLTHPQYLVMLVVWEHHTISMVELGQRLHLDSGTLSPLLKRLEQAGLISRRRRAADERIVEVTASATGRMLRRHAAEVPILIAQATGMTAAETAALRDTLQVLTMRLHAAELHLNPPRPVTGPGNRSKRPGGLHA